MVKLPDLLLHFLVCCLSCSHPSLNHQNNFATNTFLTFAQVSVNQQNMKPIICQAGSYSSKEVREMVDFL